MSYTEYLRRKAAAAPVIVDTRLRLDASSYTQRVKFAASRQIVEANVPSLVPIDTPGIVSVVNTGGLGFHITNSQMVFDPSGNLYIIAKDSNSIFKMTPAGVVSVFAGSGSPSTADGIGGAAAFNAPIGICIDSTGTNMYVSEHNGFVIRKIVLATAAVTTFAGSGVAGNTNGTGTSAQFNYPGNLCMDTSDNIYTVDYISGWLRKITTPGAVVTRLDDGIVSLISSIPIACDKTTGFIYTCSNQGAIVRISPAGVTSVFAGTLFTTGYVDAVGAAARFTFGIGSSLAFDSSFQNLYVMDNGANNRIRRITIPGAVVTTFAGSGATGSTIGPALSASFTTMSGIVVDSSNNVFLYDRGTNRLNKITQGFTTITESMPVNKSKPGGRVPDASVFTQYTAGQAVGKEVQAPRAPDRLTLNSNAAGSLSGCRTVPEPVPYNPAVGGVYTPNMVPLTGSQPARNAIACRQLQGEPHRPSELGPSLFVDDTITGIKNYNLPQNNAKTYVASECTRCGTNGAQIGKTCVFCIGADHTHSADMPTNTRWGPRPRKSAQPIIVNASPSNARKVGNFAPRKIPFVEKHHGNDNIGRIIYPKTPYRIPAGTPAQLKINNPKNIPMV